MKTTFEQRRALEIERGRVIGQRKQREQDLSRLVQGKKVQVNVDGHEHQFFVDGVAVAKQSMLADDYPGEGVMATILLAVGATVGTDGLPPVEHGNVGREDEVAHARAYRDKHLGQWREHYDKSQD